MIATVTAFSLFTAYQFLSPGKLVFTPKSKMRPYPPCVCWRLCAYMMEMIATSFFFAYCVSNFELRFYFKTALTTAWIRVTIQHLQKKDEGVLCSLLLIFSDHMVIISFRIVDHMWCRYVSSLLSIHFLSAGGGIFECFCRPKSVTTWLSFYTRIWPHLWP